MTGRRRLLPQWVTSYKDRHGKERLRFRRTGFKPYTFRAKFGTEDFRSEYRTCLDGGTPVGVGESRIMRGSVSDLVSRYYRSQSFLAGAFMTQRKNRGILEGFREQFADDRVDEFRFEHIDAILAAKRAKFPAAARNLRKQLRRLFEYAVKVDMIRVNPVELTEQVAYKTAGHHTWTEAEIERFEATHPIGSTPRLAMALMLWTGARKGDAVKLGLANVIEGQLHYRQDKTGKALILPVAPQLLEAITATQPSDVGTFLATSFGKPYSANGFGNRFRDWCNEAGLPHCSAHGLRKAISRRLAELNSSNQSIKTVTGHSGDDEVALYTRAVDQRRLADTAIRALADWDLANRVLRIAKGSDKSPE